MIQNNFARLLGERLEKMTDVHKATTISRNTLTNLYYRRCKGIEFKTLDKLCRYLDCKIEDIIEYKKDKES